MIIKIKPDDRAIYSTQQLCDHLGINRSTLKRWVDEGCPQEMRGWYDLVAVMRWRGYIGAGKPKTDEELESLSLMERKMEAEVRLKEAQGELAELKRDIANGTYIERELVEADLTRFFIVFKTAMRTLPRKIGVLLSGLIEPIEARRIEQEAQNRIDKTLAEFVTVYGR